MMLMYGRNMNLTFLAYNHESKRSYTTPTITFLDLVACKKAIFLFSTFIHCFNTYRLHPCIKLIFYNLVSTVEGLYGIEEFDFRSPFRRIPKGSYVLSALIMGNEISPGLQ